MKLALIGGGGIRTPLFIDSLIQRQMVQLGQQLIGRVTLMDIQADRLAVTLNASKFLRDRLGSDLLLEATTDLPSALEDADFIITTLRVGFEAGRVIDERVSLENGCIGQETTGPGGFAMAMRSIPEVLNVARVASQIAPKAWIINFTNPSGIVSQALHDAGYDRVVGICDSADALHNKVASSINLPPSELETQVFGLNHCSLTQKMIHDGQDITPRLLSSSSVHKKVFAIFKPRDILGLGGLPNEYLYYYLYPKQAFNEMVGQDKTRGEKIEEMNRKFFTNAHRSKYRNDPGAVLALHKRILHSRHESYMKYAWENTEFGLRPAQEEENEGEGYAGVALDFMEAVTSNKPVNMALNVPAGSPVLGLGAHEIVECTCKVSRKKIEPVLPAEISPKLHKLIHQVKVFETLTCQAARQKSRKLALWALEANPLVQSASVAKKLLDGFTERHGGVFEELG